MKRIVTGVLLVLALVQAGCGPRPAAGPQAAPAAPAIPSTAPALPTANAPASATPAPPVAPKAPDLAHVSSPYDLSLDELTEGLRAYLPQGTGTPGEKLAALYQRWGLKAGADPRLPNLLLTEADLNGDGAPETITALNARRAGRDTEGALFVIHEDSLQIDRSVGGGEPGVGFPRQAVLLAVRDVTGDGRPDIVWASLDRGAHTAYAHFFVATWEPGRLTVLPDHLYMTFPAISFDGQEILLHGGGIGSAGAGMLQRAYTDRYRWQNSRFHLVDRRYDPSNFAYHRLIDGITAETYNRPADAVTAYRDALAPPAGRLLEQSVLPQWRDRFLQAVAAYARFRLGALLYRTGRAAEAEPLLNAATGPYAGLSRALLQAGDAEQGCIQATAWATAHPELVDALNSPMGYANPFWTAGTLCGALPRPRS